MHLCQSRHIAENLSWIVLRQTKLNDNYQYWIIILQCQGNCYLEQLIKVVFIVDKISSNYGLQ